MTNAAEVLAVRAIDFAEVRAALGSGEERRCAAILKALPRDDAGRAVGRAVTALLCGAEGQVLSDAEPFAEGAVRRLDPVLTEAFRVVLSHLARGGPVSLPSGRDLGWHRLRRRPLFGVDGPWGGLSREETAAFAATLTGTAPFVVEAARKGLGLLALSSGGP